MRETFDLECKTKERQGKTWLGDTGEVKGCWRVCAMVSPPNSSKRKTCQNIGRQSRAFVFVICVFHLLVQMESCVGKGEGGYSMPATWKPLKIML